MRNYLTAVLLLICLWFTVPALAQQENSKIDKLETKRDRSERKEARLTKKAERKERKLLRQEKKTRRRESKLNREQHKLERAQDNREPTSPSQVSFYKKEEHLEHIPGQKMLIRLPV